MGLLFVNGICYSDSSETNGVIPITWDQYSNLTEEQKMNDIPYYITDAPSGYALASKTRTITTPTSLATFNASAMPMPKLKVSVEAKQAGSGVPSPENVRPISGWDAANVSDVDDVDNPTVTQTTTISLGQTVYGAEVDVVNGVLRITWKSVDMGSLTWSYSPTYTRFSSTGVQNEIKSGNNQDEVMCSCYGNVANEDMNAFKTTNGLIMVKDSNYTDTATFKQSVIGQQFVYMLETPIIIPLTPSLIKSLNGQNNLSVDCGEVIEGEYLAPLGTDIAMNNQLYGAGEAVLSEYSNKAEAVLQKQLHHTGSSVEEHKILFSSGETTSTDQNKGDAYDSVSKDDGFSYYTSDNEHGLVLTTLGKNMVEDDYLTFASLTNKQLMMFSRPDLSSGTQPDIMTVKPDDIVISKGGWDGKATNSSLKTTLAKARKGVSDYTLTSYGSSTNCDWSDSFVHKNNGVVYLNAFVEVTSNLSAGDTIFTFNNNTPICPYNIGDAGFPVIVEDGNDNLTLNYISCLDNNNFDIKKPVSAGNYINVSFVYLNNKGE